MKKMTNEEIIENFKKGIVKIEDKPDEYKEMLDKALSDLNEGIITQDAFLTLINRNNSDKISDDLKNKFDKGEISEEVWFRENMKRRMIMLEDHVDDEYKDKNYLTIIEKSKKEIEEGIIDKDQFLNRLNRCVEKETMHIDNYMAIPFKDESVSMHRLQESAIVGRLAAYITKRDSKEYPEGIFEIKIVRIVDDTIDKPVVLDEIEFTENPETIEQKLNELSKNIEGEL